jgi:hypothetical protein
LKQKFLKIYFAKRTDQQASLQVTNRKMAKNKDKTGETTKTKSKKASKKTAPARAAVIDGVPAAATQSPVPPELRRASGKNKAAAVQELSRDDIALRAYYIAEGRRRLNMAGDELGDWVEAERQLRNEAPEKST